MEDEFIANNLITLKKMLVYLVHFP